MYANDKETPHDILVMNTYENYKAFKESSPLPNELELSFKQSFNYNPR